MGSKKKRNLERKGRDFKNMISCPICGASSYARVFRDPQNEQEANAIMCGACGIDLRPIIEYNQMEEAKEKVQALMARHENQMGETSVPPEILASMAEEANAT